MIYLANTVMQASVTNITPCLNVNFLMRNVKSISKNFISRNLVHTKPTHYLIQAKGKQQIQPFFANTYFHILSNTFFIHIITIYLFFRGWSQGGGSSKVIFNFIHFLCQAMLFMYRHLTGQQGVSVTNPFVYIQIQIQRPPISHSSILLRFKHHWVFIMNYHMLYFILVLSVLLILFYFFNINACFHYLIIYVFCLVTVGPNPSCYMTPRSFLI